jgi:2-dehydro-3-deoxyphosphogalactonate aldolase
MELKDWLARCPLIAILRGVKPDEVEAIAAALEDAGLGIIEVPLNSPDPIESIRRLAARFGDRLLIGAGTVMTPAQVDEIAAAGGKLIVTPHAAVDVVRAAKARGMLACPGCFTPTEAFALLAAGADALKLFPAEAASPAVLRGINAVLPPGTLMLPVGGIDAGNMRLWREAGAAGFGMASSIYRPGDSAHVVAGKAAALQAALRDEAPSPAPTATAAPAPTDFYAAGMAVRRQVLGAAHVDRATTAITNFDRDFQAFITRTAWGGVWTRPGLDRRTRSLLTMALMAALGHHEEFKLHVRAAAGNGATHADIAEMLIQVAAYAGIPAANSAVRMAKEVFRETAP